jgi:hypothetical protein
MNTNKRKSPGRAVAENPTGRFEKYRIEQDADWQKDEEKPKTQYIQDRSRSIIAYNNSPDVGFNASINPRRDWILKPKSW